MNSKERVQLVLDGRLPDRPPYSFWHHFPADRVSGRAALEAHLEHLDDYRVDFLKVMNDNPYPHQGPIESAKDLASIVELRGDEEGFALQLDLLAALRSELRGRVLMTTTVFNPWAVLRRLVQPPRGHRPPVMNAGGDEASRRIKSFFAENPAAVQAALMTISANLADFAQFCLKAGADGIFLSVRDDWLDGSAQGPSLYDELVTAGDLAILGAAASGSFNVLHVCGTSVRFARFAAYPVHVINWADREAGPRIDQVREWIRPAVCAGIDNLSTLPDGRPEDVEREVADALEQAAGRPIMLAPGCTYAPELVPRDNLEALARSARASLYR